MALFVAEGKSLRMGLHCRIPRQTLVTFKRSDGEVVGPPLTLEESAFTPAGKDQFQVLYSWTGAGLRAAERSTKLTMENNKPESTSKPAEIVVFRDRLVVKAVREDDVAVGIPGVRVRVTVTPDAEWKKATSFAQAGYTADLDTNDHGAAIFENLPFGELRVEFLSPATLIAWEGMVGETFTAKVKKNHRVALLAPLPVAASAPHKQWVNLDASKAAGVGDNGGGAHYGSLIEVKVKVVSAAPAGQTVWLGALFDAKNSPRTGLPRPALDGVAAVPGTLLVRSKVVDGEGVAVFPLELGAAGGDKVTLFAAGHAGAGPDSHDAATSLITWRRLELREVRLKVTGADAAAVDEARPQLAPGTKSKIESELARGFIETRWTDNETADVTGDVAVVTGELAELLYLDPSKKSLLWTVTDGPDKTLLKAPYTFYPPRLYVIPVHKMVKESQVASWAFDLDEEPDDQAKKSDQKHKAVGNIRATVPLPNPGGFFLQRDWTGKSTVVDWKKAQPKKAATTFDPEEPAVERRASYWKTASGPEVEITESYIQIVPDSSNLKANLKVPKADRPRLSSKAKVFLKLRMFNSTLGSSTAQWVSVVINNPAASSPAAAKNPLRVAYATLHEIGHALGLSVKDPSSVGYGPATDNPLHYIRAVNDGSHCAYGVGDPASKPWDDQASPEFGRCILFSPARGSAPYEEITVFCDTCLSHIKAASLGMHNAKSDLSGFR